MIWGSLKRKRKLKNSAISKYFQETLFDGMTLDEIKFFAIAGYVGNHEFHDMYVLEDF